MDCRPQSSGMPESSCGGQGGSALRTPPEVVVPPVFRNEAVIVSPPSPIRWGPVQIPPSARWYLPCKLAGEFAFSLVLLLFTMPLILVAMALVKLTSPGPVLYMQTRVGRRGKPFTILKIRTMRHHAESLTGARWSTAGDNRITPVGRWLRKTHLDELPQLWNVLKGDMSLIGPRPERPEFVPQLEQAINHYRARLLVRPGLTGIAQIQLPPDSDLGSVRTKLAYDLHYIRGLGPWLEVRIYFATLLHLAGVSFSWIRILAGFAPRESIEQAYHSLPFSEPRSRPGSKGVINLDNSGALHLMG